MVTTDKNGILFQKIFIFFEGKRLYLGKLSLNKDLELLLNLVEIGWLFRLMK